MSTPVAALRGEADMLIPGPSIKAFNGAGRSRQAGSFLVYSPVCAINDCS